MAREKFEEAIRLYVETTGDDDLGKLTDQLLKLSKGSDAAADRAGELLGELEKLASVSSKIQTFTRLKGDLSETAGALDAAKVKLAGLGAEFDRTTQPSEKLQRSMAKAAAEVERLSKQQNRQQVELIRTTQALGSAGVDTGKLAAASTDLQAKMAGVANRASVAADQLGRSGREAGKAAAGIGGVGKAAESGASSLASVAGKLSLVSTAAVSAVKGLAALSGAALFSGALKSATTLEDAMSQVKAVTNATASEMTALKLAAEAGAGATRFSALEAAQGLGELARSTGSATSAIAALTPTLNLAQSAGIGVAEAAQFITTTLTQFGLKGAEAARVADVLSQAANTTDTTVTGLGNSLTYVASLAQQLGYDVEQTTAILGKLGDEGFRGERAGTALRNVFAAMSDPASSFSKSLRDLRIDTTTFASTLDGLAASGSRGLDAILEIDAEARPAILQLVSKGGDGIRKLDQDLRNASGSAAQVAKVMGDNVAGAADKVGNTFDRVRRSLVEPLLGPLQKELSGLATELEAFAQSPEFEEIRVALQELFAEGASAAKEFVREVDFREVASSIRDFLRDTDGSLAEFRANLGLVVDAVQATWQTIEVAFNSIQTIVLGVAGVATEAIARLASTIDLLTFVPRKIAELTGAMEEGAFSLQEFTSGMDAVSSEFFDRMAVNASEAAEAIAGYGTVFDGATRTAAAGSLAAASAAEASATAARAQSDAAEQAAGGLSNQAAAAERMASASRKAGSDVAVSAEKIKAAFSDLGIQSQESLNLAADAARNNFDTIRKAVAAGKATAEDAKRAFLAYAAAARAAVADTTTGAKERVQGELEALAAVHRATDALRAMGNEGETAGRRVGQGATSAASALDSVSAAAASAGTNTEGAGDASKNAADQMKEASKEGQQFALSLYEVSEAGLKATMATNRFAGMTEWSTRLNEVTARINAQGDALHRQVAELQAANAQFDELAQRRAELSGQFNLLGAGEINKLLAAEQELEQNRERAAAKRRAADDEAARAAAEASGSAGAAETVEISRQAAATAQATSAVLERAQQAAQAISVAASSVKSAATSEIVLRIVNDSPEGAKVSLKRSDLDYIVAEVLRRLQHAKGVST